MAEESCCGNTIQIFHHFEGLDQTEWRSGADQSEVFKVSVILFGRGTQVLTDPVSSFSHTFSGQKGRQARPGLFFFN